jgi:hypothetical protein
MSPRGGKGRKPRRSGLRTLAGLAVLGLAGAGLWIGSGLVEDGGFLAPRSLEREEGEPRAGVLRPPIPAPGERVRVEVLNSGGVRGVAALARDELRDAGFDVVHYGNDRSFDLEEPEVVLRAGRVEAAREVARTLGIQALRVEPDSALLVEVTVRLGSRWQDRAAREDRESGGESERVGPGPSPRGSSP